MMNVWVEFLITLFLGYLGVPYFIKGDYKKGFIYLFTMGLFGIGWFIDVVKSFKLSTDNLDMRSGKFIGTGIRITIWTVVIFIFVSVVTDETSPPIVWTILYLVVSLSKFMKVKQKKAKINTNKQQQQMLLKSIEEMGLQEKEVHDLILLPDELCYFAEEVGVSHLSSEGKIRNIGMLYITNERVVFNSIEFMFDKVLNDITYINDIDVLNNIISIQFGMIGYKIQTEKSEFLKVILRKLVNEKKKDQGVMTCEYCGVENYRTEKKCINCGAPINKK